MPERKTAEGRLPRHAHAFDDRVGEVGVEAHAGCEGERVVSERAHHDGAEGGAEAGACRDRGEGHAGLREDGRVHEDDVRHRDEGGEAGEGFGSPVGVQLRKVKVVLQTAAHRLLLPSCCGKDDERLCCKDSVNGLLE